MVRHPHTHRSPASSDARGFLQSIRQDEAGNALAMLAASMLPIVGLAGSAIDLARFYAVGARLQQACDAGALAARKMMTDITLSDLSQEAVDQGNAFFANNFRPGYMGSIDSSFSPRWTTNFRVAATASATVPTMLMQVFGIRQKVMNVSCEARHDIADADVMFVLDTTGSMAATPSGSGGGSVYAFTRTDGTRGFASAEASSAKIKSLRTAVADFYDTVEATRDPSSNFRYGFVPYSQTVNVGRLLQSGWIRSTTNYASRRNSSGTWVYENRDLDTSTFKTFAATNNPTTSTSSTSTWDGCVEERISGATDINSAPTSEDTRWGPMWPGVTYARNDGNSYFTDSKQQNLYYVCPAPARRLATMTRAQIVDYLKASGDFRPHGYTYHELGMAWGARLISPNGMFRNDTAPWPNRDAPARHIIFMSDGAMTSNNDSYTGYGVHIYSGRLSGSTSTSDSSLVNLQNARFLSACAAARAENITIHIVAFGTSITPQMTSCAPGRTYAASNEAQLRDAFRRIASNVAKLRLSQ